MKAFYAGSFDPFTIGHFSIARRALQIFGDLIIGVGVNESKRAGTSIEERLDNIRRWFSPEDKVRVVGYTGLTATVAKEEGAGVLVRGVRNTLDFEKEKELADINLMVMGIPTVMLPSEPGLSYISSSMVRELSHFGHDVAPFVAVPDKENN